MSKITKATLLLVGALLLTDGGIGNASAQEGKVTASRRDRVESKRYMDSDATLYRNGLFTVQTTATSEHWTRGLRGHSLFVVMVDEKGRAVWVSQLFRPPTIGGRTDPSTSSIRKDTFTENIPEVAAQATRSMDIFQSGGSLMNARADWIKRIKEMKDVAEELKRAQAALK